MDPISQAALGGVVGHAVAGHKLGRSAVALGAVAGAFPDIDVLFYVGGSFFDHLVLHRGITHALVFAPVVGPLLGYLWWRGQYRDAVDMRRWCILVAVLALWSHPLLDVLTTYGTQLLLPFSDARFAIPAMPIIDPIYTGLLLAGLILLWPPTRRHTRAVSAVALLVSSTYLGYGWLQNRTAQAIAEADLASRGVELRGEVRAFPTVLQTHLRRLVARDVRGVDHVAYVTTWRPHCRLTWGTRRNAHGDLVTQFLETREGAIMDWFSMGLLHYALDDPWEPTRLIAADLRYGFTLDPADSLFSASMQIHQGRAGVVEAGRTLPRMAQRDLLVSIRNTYRPGCGPLVSTDGERVAFDR